MHECGRLQGMPGLLPAKVALGDPVKCAIHHLHQPIARDGITGAQLPEQLSNVGFPPVDE